MTSTVPPSNAPVNAPNAKSASPSATAPGTTSSNVRSSYANAATKGSQPGSSQASLGGLALSQHAHSKSQSPVNGRPSAPPAVPTGPAIVSSTNGVSDHSRAPSVTITAQGSNYPNGTATGPSRPNISFGSIGGGASPSPSMAHTTPHMHSTALSQPYSGPNPARSPSPIPPPNVSSGGRPPSSLAGTNPVNFGSLPGGEGGPDPSLAYRPGIPSGPQNQQHNRHGSSQSVNSNNNFNHQNGRNSNGRGPYQGQNFPGGPNAASPNVFRPALAMNQRTPSNVGPPYSQQMRAQGSPYQANRSPMPGIAQPHMNSPMPHPYGYNPMPQDPSMYMPQPYAYGQYPGFAHPNGAYMGNMQQMGMQYGQGPQPSPQMQQQQAPTPFNTRGSYAPPLYPTGPGANAMSRTSSTSGDPRPTSSMGGQSPAPQSASAPSPSPGPSNTSFTRPAKKTSAIRITNADGELVDFRKSVQSPAAPSPASRGPAVVSSGGPAATPPRTLTPSQQQTRPEPVQTKTADEKKKEFEEAVKRQLEQEKKDAEVKSEPETTKSQKVENPVKVEDKPIEPVPAKEEEKKEEVADVKEDSKPELAEAQPKPKEESESEPEAAASGETEEERKKREEDEEFERMIAEMEAQEKAEEERERAFAEKKKQANEEKKAKEAELAKNADDEMKRLEAEAEAREEDKLKGKSDADQDAEAQNLFSQLKKNSMFGPGADAPESESSTPGSESPMPPPAQPASQTKPAPLGKSKPAALKLETQKSIEPAAPTAGMQSLKSARFLQVQDEIKYPEQIQSPNPALQTGKKGQRYDNSFLLQFRDVFKEKPSVDWDKVIKDTVGDGTDSARSASTRTPAMAQGRTPSARGGMPAPVAMGAFGAAGSRVLPAGTTSEQRFQASMNIGGRPQTGMPFGSFPAGRPGSFPMAPGMARSPSAQSMQNVNSPRNASQRGKGSRRGGVSAAQENELKKKMPLTYGQDVKALEASGEGWKPTSLVGGQPQALPNGHLTPELVQRKVKAALNKMTPSNFDKVSQSILDISSQSKDETDGRTLRQVIQLCFEKACDEAHWASMYAQFCRRMLLDMGNDIRDETVKDKNGVVVTGGALFRKYLLNRCQEEFEQGWEVNLPKPAEGQTEEAAMLSDEYYIAAAAKRKGLGLIQFIGELYKLQMLTLRIMHECVVKLLNFEGIPDEAAIESLIKLLRTIGATMDADPKGHSMIDTYMDRVEKIMNMPGLPSRMYYMLLDTLDLRRKDWHSKEDAKGPKTIQEIRDDAAAQDAAKEMERQRSARGPGGRAPAGRGDARSFSGGMPAPDYPRNQVGMDDLKRLTRNARNTGGSAPSGLGPGSLLSSSRNGSRRGLGPRADGESGGSSRTGTPPVKEPAAHQNAYSALAALDGDHPDDVASPPSQHASPALTKVEPATTGEDDAGKS